MKAKSRILYLVGLIVFTYFALNFFKSSYQGKVIDEQGMSITGIVSSTPNCGRSSNTMEVEYNQKKYTISIGKNDCIEGKYRIGDKVNALYSSVYDRMQLPTNRVNLLYIMSMLFFIIPLYFLFMLLRPFK